MYFWSPKVPKDALWGMRLCYKSISRPIGHIASKIYRTRTRISQIPQGIYIAGAATAPTVIIHQRSDFTFAKTKKYCKVLLTQSAK